ncbi:MAG: sporulation initiation factor Spo0A C-terminal domain-containing protein [Aristaeellaceae bacterium]
MLSCLAVADGTEKAEAWQMLVEDFGPDWVCRPCGSGEEALVLLRAQSWQVAVCCGQEGAMVRAQLRERPPLAPPWLLTDRPCPWADALVYQPEALPDSLTRWEDEGRLPQLALLRHAQLTCLARGLLHAMTMPERLKAWRFLPDMAAMMTVHPSLMEDLQGRLYALTARRHGMSASAVERSLRLAIESTWSGASLNALERFFGHSVDPERGKPTNREFLYRVQERLMLAGMRLL